MKDFVAWTKTKTQLEAREVVPEFTERDIWWCSLGENIGYEEDGKNQHFERPVCVLKKFNKDIFIGLPLTSTQKQNRYYFPYALHETEGSIVLSQCRLLSAKRLQRKLSRMGRGSFSKLKNAYLAQY
jgi:mRNA interferase MazF